jgi:hypothetical protein
MSDGEAIPIGTVVPDNDAQSAARSGLYPTPSDDTAMCCWLAPEAVVYAVKSNVAERALVRILVPSFTFFQVGQTVTIAVGGIALSPQSLAPGVHVLAVALPPRLRGYVGRVPITIRSSRTFVPAHEGVNTDTRALGIILVGVTFT